MLRLSELYKTIEVMREVKKFDDSALIDFTYDPRSGLKRPTGLMVQFL